MKEKHYQNEGRDRIRNFLIFFLLKITLILIASEKLYFSSQRKDFHVSVMKLKKISRRLINFSFKICLGLKSLNKYQLYLFEPSLV